MSIQTSDLFRDDIYYHNISSYNDEIHENEVKIKEIGEIHIETPTKGLLKTPIREYIPLSLRKQQSSSTYKPLATYLTKETIDFIPTSLKYDQHLEYNNTEDYDYSTTEEQKILDYSEYHNNNNYLYQQGSVDSYYGYTQQEEQGKKYQKDITSAYSYASTTAPSSPKADIKNNEDKVYINPSSGQAIILYATAVNIPADLYLLK